MISTGRKEGFEKCRKLSCKSFKWIMLLFEKMSLNYYEGIVQHLINWAPKAPKIAEQ